MVMNTPSISTRKKKSFEKLLTAWYKQSGRSLPWRETNNPYAILVSELMLQQTQVDRVIPKYESWMKRFPTIEVVSRARTKTILSYWQGLGYNRRALYIQKIAKIITQQHNGIFPKTKEELLLLPGIGPYTAGAILSFAYHKKEPIVDTNVERVVGRICIGYEKLGSLSSEEMWESVTSLLPEKEQVYTFNQALMDFGALVCTATAPQCNTCPMQKICLSYPRIKKASTQELRYKKKSNEKQYFGKPRRIWRGKILSYIHRKKSATITDIGNAIQDDFSSDRIPWLEEVIATLEKDGLIKREKNNVTLP